MFRYKTFNRQKAMVIFVCVLFMMTFLMGRLVYLMVFCSEYYGQKAEDLHERERDIKAARGKIIDATGVVLADNKTVCTISVIHNQISDPEAVIAALTKELGIAEEKVRARVEKVSSIERIKSNVDKETGERIRAYGLSGVKVDEDYKRYYPYDTLASKVLGFTGGDNQGIVGLEVKYDEYMQGTNGKILTLTDARGVEIENAGESRLDPIDGNDLHISLDYNIQMYAEQAAGKALAQKQADSVSIIVMNPSNGELMAMVNVPEFNLNDPFTLNYEPQQAVTEEEKQNLLNNMWRNQCINDTYEPGSTFKIITTTAALEEGVVSLSDQFFCPGYITVEDRRIHCHKRTGHGAEDFVHGIMNSCNPVFIDVGLRVGPKRFYDYFESLGLLKKTGIDLPGEAATIMHSKENIGLVELATMSFGQSFQITPIQLVTTVSSIINGGRRITPHFGVAVKDGDGNTVKEFTYGAQEGIVSTETSEKVRFLLGQVVSEGGGKNAKIAGYEIGGKTATSQTLPRSANKYISSFLGFAPASDPKVMVLVIINNPQGVYYGGTIAAPVAKEIFEDILPYLDIPFDEEAAKENEVR
ncbi:MAG: peptidoglycan glycosyltransferase [Eubacterium sp.]|jgi:stage V sporulation protein D (sporulation-specific penicillin-binding protein)|nr:peptidoglycan glycosyltransferase [Eubacterium sp.]